MRSAVARYRIHGLLFALGVVLGVAAYARIGPDAARVDPGVQAALLLVISVTLAATAGAAGAVIGASIAADAARESAAKAQQEAQTDRDDARQARELDRRDARMVRFADRKFELAVELLRAADIHSREATQYVASRLEDWEDQMTLGTDRAGPFPTIHPTDPVRAAYLALDLVAPAMAPTAAALYEATVPLGSLAVSWLEPDRAGADNNEWARKWAEALEGWQDARHDFVDAVRADLGVNPDGRPGA
jgi:hypothetical protein